MNELSTEVKAKETHEKAVGYFKVFEQYGYKFIMEVRKIRDDRHYKELGFSSFEEYCNSAWGFTRQWMNAKIQSASKLNESDFDNYSFQFGIKKTFLLATMEDEQREQAINEGVPTEQGNKSIDEATQKEINEYRRKYKELEQAKQQAEQQTEQAKKSEQIMQKQLEESESKKPETIEVIKEVESEDLQRQLRFSQKENERLSEKQENHKLKDTTNFNEEEAKLEMKKLQSEADRTTIEIRIAFKKLNDRVSVSRYLSDAISCGNDYEKKKMSEEIKITENILHDIKTAILGRKEIN